MRCHGHFYLFSTTISSLIAPTFCRPAGETAAELADGRAQGGPYLFRGDARPPEVIERDGFLPRNGPTEPIHYTLLNHVDPPELKAEEVWRTAFVSTSQDERQAIKFALVQARSALKLDPKNDAVAYVYQLYNAPNSINVNPSFRAYNENNGNTGKNFDNRFDKEVEYAFAGGIPPGQVISSRKLTLKKPDGAEYDLEAASVAFPGHKADYMASALPPNGGGGIQSKLVTFEDAKKTTIMQDFKDFMENGANVDVREKLGRKNLQHAPGYNCVSGGGKLRKRAGPCFSSVDDNPSGQKKPGSPDSSDVQKKPESPDSPDAQKKPEAPDSPDAQKKPGTPDSPDVQKKPEAPDSSSAPKKPDSPDTSKPNTKPNEPESPSAKPQSNTNKQDANKAKKPKSTRKKIGKAAAKGILVLDIAQTALGMADSFYRHGKAAFDTKGPLNGTSILTKLAHISKDVALEQTPGVSDVNNIRQDINAEIEKNKGKESLKFDDFMQSMGKVNEGILSRTVPFLREFAENLDKISQEYTKKGSEPVPVEFLAELTRRSVKDFFVNMTPDFLKPADPAEYEAIPQLSSIDDPVARIEEFRVAVYVDFEYQMTRITSDLMEANTDDEVVATKFDKEFNKTSDRLSEYIGKTWPGNPLSDKAFLRKTLSDHLEKDPDHDIYDHLDMSGEGE